MSPDLCGDGLTHSVVGLSLLSRRHRATALNIRIENCIALLGVTRMMYPTLVFYLIASD